MMRKCLTFGGAVALIAAVLWGSLGFHFSGLDAVRLGSRQPARRPSTITHFVVSNLLCGMIAATQSYYVVTFLTVRYCYPWLMQSAAHRVARRLDLADLVRRGRIVLGLTVSVPFIVLPAVVVINFDRRRDRGPGAGRAWLAAVWPICSI